MTKQDLIQRIQELPEDAPLENIEAALESVQFKIRVDRGLRQAEQGETVPHEEIEKMIDGWLEE